MGESWPALHGVLLPRLGSHRSSAEVVCGLGDGGGDCNVGKPAKNVTAAGKIPLTYGAAGSVAKAATKLGLKTHGNDI